MNKPTKQAQARKQLLAARAHFHRHQASEPERCLWEELRGGKLGIGFKRQVAVGSAIADFIAPAIGLVVEVDGASHQRKVASDQRRDRDLRRAGYSVLRIDAQLVLGDLPQAVALIRKRVAMLQR